MAKGKILIFAGLGLLSLTVGLLFVWVADEQAPPPQERLASSPASPPAAAVAQPGSGEAEKERALKVGVIGPETGEGAVYGVRIRDGILIAARRFNDQGGIDGKAIKVLHYDNKGDPQRTLQIASYLIEQNVAAIFAAPTGWSTFGPTRMANSSRTIFIAVGTRRRFVRSGDYVFRYSLPDEIATDDLLRFSVNVAGYVDYALVTSSAYDYSLSVSSSFKQAVLRRGGRILVEADTYDTYSGKTDLDAVVKALRTRSRTLQAIIFTGNDKEGARLARAAQRAGMTLPFIGSEDLFTEAFLTQGGDAVKGTLLYTTFSPHNGSSRLAEFMQKHGRENGGVPDRFAALAYDAFTQFAEAVRSAGSTKSSAVRDAFLKRKAAEGVTGRTSWAPDGTPVKHPFIYRVERNKEGNEFVLLGTGDARSR